MPETTQTKEEILPKHTNGTTERMHRIEVDRSLGGLFETSCVLTELTANQEIEATTSRACGVHVANGISAKKAELSLIRAYSKEQDPRMKEVYLQLMAPHTRALLALEAPKESEAAPPASSGEAS
jgi:hypothetical protein